MLCNFLNNRAFTTNRNVLLKDVCNQTYLQKHSENKINTINEMCFKFNFTKVYCASFIAIEL